MLFFWILANSKVLSFIFFPVHHFLLCFISTFVEKFRVDAFSLLYIYSIISFFVLINFKIFIFYFCVKIKLSGFFACDIWLTSFIFLWILMRKEGSSLINYGNILHSWILFSVWVSEWMLIRPCWVLRHLLLCGGGFCQACIFAFALRLSTLNCNYFPNIVPSSLPWQEV